MIESLEARRLLATVSGTVGNDTIIVSISGTNIVVNVNGTPNNFSDAANTTIIVNAGDGNDTVTVISPGNNATTINGGIGNDSILVGGNDYDANTDAAVRVNGDAGTDTLQIDDDGDLAGDGSDVSVLNGTTFDEPLASPTTFGTTEAFQYFGGTGGERFNVDVVPAGLSVTVAAGDGNDSIEVGAGDYDLNIAGPVFVNAGAGTDTLEVEDGLDTGNDTYTQDTTFTKNSAVAAAVLSQSFVERFEISAPVGVANNTFNINRIVAGVLIVVGAGDGSDTINVGNGDFDANLFRVSVLGDAGVDVLNFNDQSAGADQYDLFSDTLVKNNSANDQVYWDANLENLVVNGSANADLYNVNATNAAVNFQINAGDGNDTLNAAGPNGPFVNDLDNAIVNTTIFNGGVGTDSVILDDVGDSNDPESYFLSGTQFSKGSGLLNFGTTERFDLRANGGNNALTYGPFLGGQNATVDGGAGNDTITSTNINNEVFPLATVLVEGGAGTDAWIVNDSGDIEATEYRLTSTTLQVTAGAPAGGPVSYNTFESISITTNNVATNFLLDSYGTTPLTLNLADGDDTLTIGGGDLDSNIDINLTVNGGAGSDRIVVDDSTDGVSADTLVLTTGLITKGVRTLAYTAFEGQRYFGNAQPTVITLDSGNIPTTISGGAGNEFLSVAPTGDDIDAFASSLVFTGGAGSDTVSFNDSLDTLDDEYLLTATTLTKPLAGAFQGFTYSQLERFGITAGAANHTFTIDGLASGVDYPLNAGGGNDTFNLGGSDNVADQLGGSATLNGEAGTDRLNYLDASGTVARTFTVTNATIDRPDTGTVTYSTLEAIVINAGIAADVISVGASLAATPVTVNAGAGNDTINVGDLLGNGDLLGTTAVNTGFDSDTTNVGAGDLDEVDGAVSVAGGFIHVRDQTDGGSLGTGYTIGDDSLTRTGGTFGGLTFTSETSILFDFNQSGTPITVNDLAGGNAINGGIIQANGGIDTITVVNAPIAIIVRSGSGLDAVSVNSDGVDVANVVFDQNEDLDDLATHPGGTATVASNGSLVLDVVNDTVFTGNLNLNNNTFIQRAPVNVSFFESSLETGYNGGAWNGTAAGAIRSGTANTSAISDALGYAQVGAAANQLSITSIAGVPVATGDLIIRYTLAGDADLNRAVGFSDLVSLSQNYNGSAGGKNWRQGNFNYNTPDPAVGAVGFGDLVFLSQNYNQSVAPLLASLSTTPTKPARRVARSGDGDALAG